MTSAKLKAADSPWLGDIPAHWSAVRFRHVATIEGSLVDPREPPWSLLPMLAPNHVKKDTGEVEGLESAAEQNADSSKYPIRAGQIVYSKIRPALNKVAISPTDGTCSADMYPIDFSDRVDLRYAWYFMRARPFHSFASVTSMRVKMPKINREDLSDAPWLLPTLPEQRAIADYLDHETAQIDTLIKEQQRLIALGYERKRAVTESALAEYVGDAERLRWSIRDVDERAGTPSVEAPLLSVSIAWGVRRRDEVSDDPPRAEDLSSYKRCRRGDIVLNRMHAFQGALGVATEEGLVSPDYAVLRCVGQIEPEWLGAVMRTQAFVAEMAKRIRGIGSVDLGSARTPRINVTDLHEIRVRVPAREVQCSQLSALWKAQAAIDGINSAAESLVTFARERRSALITAAVTGKIDVGVPT